MNQPHLTAHLVLSFFVSQIGTVAAADEVEGDTTLTVTGERSIVALSKWSAIFLLLITGALPWYQIHFSGRVRLVTRVAL